MDESQTPTREPSAAGRAVPIGPDMNSPDPADCAALPGPEVSVRIDRRLRRLLTSVPFASAAPQLGFAVTAYFMALQVQAIDDAAKVANLAIVNVAGAMAAVVTQPLIGVVSDRTRTRMGARAPWMLIGALIGSAGMITAGLSRSIAVLVVAAMIVQFGFNALSGPLSAILPDRIPNRLRGRYSTLAGLGSITAAILGPFLASAFIDRIFLGYGVVAAIILVIVTAFIVWNPESDNRGVPREAFAARTFATSFWINPRRYPDFGWSFLGRILIFGGYFMLLSYQLYLAQGYIGLSTAEAAKIIPLIGAVALPGFLIAILVAGPYSDRVGRRKPLVLFGGLTIAASALIPWLVPATASLFAQGVVATIGFGAFTAVDQALVSEVLPAQENSAKDLGILNIAATLPGGVAPIIAATIVHLFGSYGALYPTAAVVALLGALAVLPIKGVR
ncbi:MFS transporter [Nocardia sp. NPDC051990]|uniref:MFS transporter n=1 Tax=Nocardia sp. NPDC051990 TaxID=3155285 RepID=UPI003420A679